MSRTGTSVEVCGPNSTAFPRRGGEFHGEQPGLTKREYIATQALQGILAHSHNDASYEGAARDAVVYADELLKALAGWTE